ncbi:MAG: ArsR/SmtB family transcription factor [Candidatus Bathyarchaeia archaeon]
MAEKDEYDVIFAALKHPMRRRILLLLEEKGEVSFTDIQKVVGVEDTGLMSYHLKELALLINQPARGKYTLSEIGKTSVALMKKVERSRDMSKVVRKEQGRIVGEIVGFLAIGALSWVAAVSVDIHASVQLIYDTNSVPMILTYAFSLLTMYSSVALFTAYDRHYFSKVLRKNILHSIIFALTVALILIPSEYTSYQFMAKTLEYAANPTQHPSAKDLYGLLMLMRTILFVVCSPLVTYSTCKLANVFSKKRDA